MERQLEKLESEFRLSDPDFSINRVDMCTALLLSENITPNEYLDKESVASISDPSDSHQTSDMYTSETHTLQQYISQDSKLAQGDFITNESGFSPRGFITQESRLSPKAFSMK